MALTLRAQKGSALTTAQADANEALSATQVAHGYSALDLVYHDGTTWELAQADADATVALGIVVYVPDADTFSVLVQPQVITAAAHGYTPGAPLFLSQATPGLITETEPGSGIVQRVGTALGAGEILWQPWAPVTV